MRTKLCGPSHVCNIRTKLYGGLCHVFEDGGGIIACSWAVHAAQKGFCIFHFDYVLPSISAIVGAYVKERHLARSFGETACVYGSRESAAASMPTSLRAWTAWRKCFSFLGPVEQPCKSCLRFREVS